MILPKVIACIPTYREPEKVSEIINSLKFIRYRPFEVFFINASPGDRTSEIIKNIKINFDFHIHEISGISSEFWSATVNRGFKKILEIVQQDDWILLMNVDIKFDTDIVDLLTQKALNQGKCQISTLSTSNGYVISSGVQVKSWMATLTRHPYAGTKIDDVPNGLLIEANYLPTRCMLFPSEALTKVGLISEKWLPHYGADYEFSHRLSKKGYKAYMYSTARIEADNQNTGKSVHSNETKLFERMKNLMSIKNPSNPKFRVIFVLLVYPIYAIPTGIFFYLIRTFLEMFLNSSKITIFFGKQERGYSK